VLGERLRHDAVAEPPAGHRVGLREAVEEDRPLPHPGEPCDRDELALVEESAVDLVREDRDPTRDGDRGDALELAPVEDAPGRVRGGVTVVRRVRDDTRRSNSSRSKPKARASRSGIGTGTPPTEVMADS